MVCTHRVHMLANAIHLHVYFNSLSYFMAQSDIFHHTDTEEDVHSISLYFVRVTGQLI